MERRTKEDLRSEIAGRSENEQAEKAHLRRQQSIMEQFRIGAQRVCGIEIWDFIVTATGIIEGEKLAHRFWMDKSSVSWGKKHGRLSLDVLIMMLTELNLEFAALPKMPSREVRALGGFQESVAFCREPSVRGDTRIKPTIEELSCLIAIHRNREWFVLNARILQSPQDPTIRNSLEDVILRIQHEASELLGRKVLPVTPAECRRLNAMWSDAFEESRKSLPYVWIVMP